MVKLSWISGFILISSGKDRYLVIPHYGKKTLILAIMGIFSAQGTCLAEARGWDDKTFLNQKKTKPVAPKNGENDSKPLKNNENILTDITELLNQLASEDASTRQAAAEKLGQAGNPHAIEPLEKSLKDPSPNVRYASASALGQLKCPQALPALLEALKESDETVRQAAAEALGILGDPKAVSPLQAAVKRDDGELVRASAVKSLGMLGQKRAVITLQTALAKDKSELVRTESAKALAQLGDRRAAKTLAIIVLKDEDQNMRFTAAEALGKLDDKQVIKKTVIALLEKPIEPKKDEDRWHLMNSRADLIAKIGPKAVPTLISATKLSNRFIKKIVLMSLGRIKDKRSVVALVTASKSEDQSDRWHAANGLGLIGDKRALPHIIPMLNDKDPDVRIRALYATVSLESPQAVTILIKAVSADENENVRANAARLLGGFPEENVEKALTKSLKDKNPRVQETAKYSLARIEHEKKKREQAKE